MPSLEEQQFRRIGRYEVIRKIATGGMAELFLARFVGPGGFEKRCALKRILPQFAADKTFTKMFLTEARVTAMFDHPNLVQIFELGQDDEGQFFIAMELVNGMNLRQLLGMVREKGFMMPPELASYMMTQALDGLQYAHDFKDPDGSALSLVHRDVSPQNLLISYEGAVKIVDFGIVKGNSISSETQAGMLKGKVAYMSPEQASGDPIDARSDLFSIGVVLYELITGEKPFTGPNEVMCLKAILDAPPAPITNFAPDCPEDIERIIYRALEKDCDERYHTAREFQEDLQAVLTACPTPLGRHVVSDYLRSMTEESTATFDATKLRIPRVSSSVRFATDAISSSDKTIPTEPLDPNNPNGLFSPNPSRPPRSQYTPVPPSGRSGSTPKNGVSRSDISGIRDETGASLSPDMRRAAGLGRTNPAIFVVFALSALAGGLLVWFLTRDARTVVVEPTFPPVEKTAVAVVTDQRAIDPKTTDDGKRTTDNGQPTTDNAKRTTDNGQPTTDNGKRTTDNGQPSTDNAKRTTDNGQPSTDNAKRTTDNGKRTTDNVQPSTDSGKRTTDSGKRTTDDAKRTADSKKGPDAKTDRGKKHEPHGNQGTLTLTSVPRGLTVLLDEKTLGKTPLVGVAIPAGTHNLKLTNKQLGIAKKMTVRVAKGLLTTETMTVGKGTLKVMSRPWADVFVDGVSKGKTPLETPIYEGTHEVRLVSPEAGERIQKIDVRPGETEDLKVKF